LGIGEVDADGFDLGGTVALDHEHKVLHCVILQEVSLGVTFYHLFKGFLIQGQLRATLNQKSECVVDEFVDFITMCFVRGVIFKIFQRNLPRLRSFCWLILYICRWRHYMNSSNGLYFFY